MDIFWSLAWSISPAPLADAKDHKMPGLHTHRIESEISQDKGQKQHLQINSPGKFPGALLAPTPFPRHANDWEEADQRGWRSYCDWDRMKISQNQIKQGIGNSHSVWCPTRKTASSPASSLHKEVGSWNGPLKIDYIFNSLLHNRFSLILGKFELLYKNTP